MTALLILCGFVAMGFAVGWTGARHMRLSVVHMFYFMGVFMTSSFVGPSAVCSSGMMGLMLFVPGILNETCPLVTLSTHGMRGLRKRWRGK